MDKGAGNKSFFLTLTYFILTAGIFLSGCRDDPSGLQTREKMLFRKLGPDETSVQFENNLVETDTFNSLFYEYYFNGAGLAIADVNNDGLSDIFFGGNMVKSRLYLNRGDMKFEDITGKSGIDTEGKWVTGVSMADLNLDGWMDIYVCVGGNIMDNYENLLYISQANGEIPSFKEKGKIIGLNDKGYSTQAAFFDYDLDGDLDMYLVTSSMKIPNKNAVRNRSADGSMINTDRLYRNEGIDAESGLPMYRNVSGEAGIVWDGFGLGIAVSDINNDGWPDVYVANDYISNDLLYINQGDGTFRDMINVYFKHTSYSAMGIDIADFNNDGLADVFTLDMLPEDYYRKRIMAGNMRDYRRYNIEQMSGYTRQYIRNMLQLNNGPINGKYSFSEIGQLAGVFETDWSWAPLFADFDNDGLKDLFIGNGIPQDLTNMDFATIWQNKMRENPDMPFQVLGRILMDDLKNRGNVKKPNVIFRNEGNYVFSNKTSAWGMEDPSYSNGSAFSDLDNDGDLDLVMNNLNDPAAIYKNLTFENSGKGGNAHYLSIGLKGDHLNPGGIGTKIILYQSGTLQYYEHFPVRGFQSMIDPQIHFGTGSSGQVDSLVVIWPDGQRHEYYGIAADQRIILDYKDSRKVHAMAPGKMEKKVFREVSNERGIAFLHREKEFLDFDIQPLVPHLYSREGPGIAVGDVNGDGMDDFFIGGGNSQSGMIFMQQATGKFIASALPGNNNFEDMGALFFDADNDADNDLYVVSGGTGLPPGNPYYTDRLYRNDGKGNFTLSRNSIPDAKICGSQVAAADFDKDGDLDLFVCGRILLENYPIPERSFLLRNDSRGKDHIQFTDITDEVGAGLLNPGLVAAALWTDFNRDGWPDLMLAGEWMPIRLFRNDLGSFEEITASAGLEGYTGWWNSLAAADFDKDGDMDYAAGNLGLNTRLKVSADQPMQVFAMDFDKNGQVDPVCSYYVQGKRYPIYHRNLLISQIPVLQRKFTTYESYAKSTLDDIFGVEQLEEAYTADSRYFNSALLENLGNGKFRIRSLPVEAQFGPVFGMIAGDFDSDGQQDLLLAGNSYSFNVEDGQSDALTGLYLKGDGACSFMQVLSRNSGFFVDGDAKGMASLSLRNGKQLVLVAQNADSLKVFEVENEGSEVVGTGNDDMSAEIFYMNGKTEYREFYYGSGYLSQSSRSLFLTGAIDSVKISSYSGRVRKISTSNKTLTKQ